MKKGDKSKHIQMINGVAIKLNNNRGDVILKTILRCMRKHYLEEFNKVTGFIKSKNNKDENFYIECL